MRPEPYRLVRYPPEGNFIQLRFAVNPSKSQYIKRFQVHITIEIFWHSFCSIFIINTVAERGNRDVYEHQGGDMFQEISGWGGFSGDDRVAGKIPKSKEGVR
jgi:hypothetical protein